MDTVTDALARIRGVIDYPLVTLGGTAITLWTIGYVLLLSLALVYASGKLRAWLVDRALARRQVELGARQAIGTITRYVVVAIGFVVIFQSTGIDLSALTVLFGALGLGLGFGLQNIINNFVSGLIILFERPIKVGDRVDVGDLRGNVVAISARATTILTNDNIAIIVPNAEFVTSRVTNWSYGDAKVRFPVPVGVAYGTDPEHVRRTLLEIAASHRGVMANPPPDVLFAAFGDSSLDFVLRVWSEDYATRPGVLRSELNYLIAETFAAEGIQIPFPQRDIHIKSGGPLPVAAS